MSSIVRIIGTFYPEDLNSNNACLTLKCFAKEKFDDYDKIEYSDKSNFFDKNIQVNLLPTRNIINLIKFCKSNGLDNVGFRLVGLINDDNSFVRDPILMPIVETINKFQISTSVIIKILTICMSRSPDIMKFINNVTSGVDNCLGFIVQYDHNDLGKNMKLGIDTILYKLTNPLMTVYKIYNSVFEINLGYENSNILLSDLLSRKLSYNNDLDRFLMGPNCWYSDNKFLKEVYLKDTNNYSSKIFNNLIHSSDSLININASNASLIIKDFYPYEFNIWLMSLSNISNLGNFFNSNSSSCKKIESSNRRPISSETLIEFFKNFGNKAIFKSGNITIIQIELNNDFSILSVENDQSSSGTSKDTSGPEWDTISSKPRIKFCIVQTALFISEMIIANNLISENIHFDIDNPDYSLSIPSSNTRSSTNISTIIMRTLKNNPTSYNKYISLNTNKLVKSLYKTPFYDMGKYLYGNNFISILKDNGSNNRSTKKRIINCDNEDIDLIYKNNTDSIIMNISDESKLVNFDPKVDKYGIVKFITWNKSTVDEDSNYKNKNYNLIRYDIINNIFPGDLIRLRNVDGRQEYIHLLSGNNITQYVGKKVWIASLSRSILDRSFIGRDDLYPDIIILFKKIPLKDREFNDKFGYNPKIYQLNNISAEDISSNFKRLPKSSISLIIK